MSMINELVDKLRTESKSMGKYGVDYMATLLMQAANTIEILSKKAREPKQGEWIPCSEKLPKPYTEVLVCDECGWISLGVYRPCDVTEKDSGWSTLTRIKLPTDEVLAWMPLPEPWEGADDE